MMVATISKEMAFIASMLIQLKGKAKKLV